jgi:hypothetical protein
MSRYYKIEFNSGSIDKFEAIPNTPLVITAGQTLIELDDLLAIYKIVTETELPPTPADATPEQRQALFLQSLALLEEAFANVSGGELQDSADGLDHADEQLYYFVKHLPDRTLIEKVYIDKSTESIAAPPGFSLIQLDELLLIREAILGAEVEEAPADATEELKGEIFQRNLAALELAFAIKMHSQRYLAIFNDELQPEDCNGQVGWRALEYEGDRLGVPKGDTWKATIPALARARASTNQE